MDMKLGLFSWYGYESPVSQRLERIARAGFTSTMLWWGEEPLPGSEINADHLKKASDLGITVENIHVPFDDANWLWAADRDIHQAYFSRYQRYADCCARSGLSTMVMHVSKGHLVQAPNAFGIDTMRRLATYCRKTGVSIAIENTRTVGLVAALLEAIEDGNFGLCYDTSHGRLYEDSEFWLLKKFPHRLKCLHISDNDGVEDRHWNIGEGIIDWNAFMLNLPKNTGCQTLSLEVYPRNKGEDETAFLQDAFSRASAMRESLLKRAG